MSLMLEVSLIAETGIICTSPSSRAFTFRPDYESFDYVRPQGYKKNFMLNSDEHEIYPAHKV